MVVLVCIVCVCDFFLNLHSFAHCGAILIVLLNRYLHAMVFYVCMCVVTRKYNILN